jgi:hypothetical protein
LKDFFGKVVISVIAGERRGVLRISYDPGGACLEMLHPRGSLKSLLVQARYRNDADRVQGEFLRSS